MKPEQPAKQLKVVQPPPRMNPSAEASVTGSADQRSPKIRLGSGVFIKSPPVSRYREDLAAFTNANGEITLNFEQTNLREFIREVFEDMLV